MNKISILILVVCALFSLVITFRPKLLLYVTTVFTLVIAGTAGYFFPSLKVLWWISYGQAALLFFMVLFCRARLRPTTTVLYPTLSKIILVLLTVFILIALFASIRASFPLKQTVFAGKSYFMMGGLGVFLALYPLRGKTIICWLKILFGIGLVQIFPVLYQYFFIRSWRIAQNINPRDAADSVVGTFGGSQTSGGLGAVMAFYLIVCLIIWLAFSKSRKFSWRKDGLILFLLWFPILFAEVKAAVIYLPLAVIILYREYSYQQPKKFVQILLRLSAIVMFMVLSLEVLHYHSVLHKGNCQNHLKNAFSYSFRPLPKNFSTSGKRKFSRIGALQFWREKHGLNNPVVTLIGHGLGASRTQGRVKGHEVLRWTGKKIDYSGLSALLWEVGLCGTAVFIAIIILMYILAGRLSRHAVLVGWQQSLAAGLQAVMPLFLLSLPYRNDIPFAAPMMFAAMGCGGLIFWLNNQGAAKVAVVNRQ